MEIVVVDEASADGTAAYLASLAHAPVSVIRHTVPVGVARARNAGLAAARGRWVAFLDDDDLWAPDRLRAQLDELAAQPGAGWACAGAVVVDSELRIIGAQRTPAPDSLPRTLLRYNVVPGGASGVVASTALVRELGGFDPAFRILADWDLWIRLALHSPLVRVDRPLVGYVLHGDNMTSQPAGFRDELDRISAKHAASRAEHAVELHEAGWKDWFAELERRGGRRLTPALGLARRAVTERRARLALQAMSMALRPNWVERRNTFRLDNMNPGWRHEAEEWLGRVRAAGDEEPEST